MPPKAKITKDMVIDAAFGVAHETGAENINARTVSKKLNCSTQPVIYHFATIEELKKAAYTKLDWYHTEYLMNIPETQEGIMLRIGLNYIRFAVENSLLEMINSKELIPVISVMQKAMNTNIEQTKEVFVIISIFQGGIFKGWLAKKQPN